jgi:Fe-S-cluster containining protein
MSGDFHCRPGCGACCIALSISSPIPGMEGGKASGVRCVHLTEDCLCRIHDSPARPQVCKNLRPAAEMCGSSREEALAYLYALEEATAPAETKLFGIPRSAQEKSSAGGIH